MSPTVLKHTSELNVVHCICHKSFRENWVLPCLKTYKNSNLCKIISMRKIAFCPLQQGLVVVAVHNLKQHSVPLQHLQSQTGDQVSTFSIAGFMLCLSSLNNCHYFTMVAYLWYLYSVMAMQRGGGR